VPKDILLFNFIWRSGVTGSWLGAACGAVYFLALFRSPSFGFVYFSVPGALAGALVGVVGGLILGLVTLIFFRQVRNRYFYQLVMRSIGVMITLPLTTIIVAGLHRLIASDGNLLIEFALVAGVIASIASLYAVHRGVNWYLQTLTA
jgi:hypothetical protein